MAKVTVSGYGDLAIIAQPANLPVVETLEFLTDVLESYDGTEQQIELRSKARQRFQYQIPIRPLAGTMQDIWNTIYGAIRKKWAIPVWTDAQYVGRVVVGTGSTVNCDTVNYDLRVGGLVLIYSACGNYAVTTIASKTDTTIVLGTVLSQTLRSSVVVPVRVGWVENDVQIPTNGYSGNININFYVDDTLEVTPSAPTQYLSNDIYYDPSLLSGDYADSNFTQRVDVVDFETGVVTRRTPWTRSKYGRQYRSLTTTPAERKTFRDFLFRRLGKGRPFWMPTFQNDLRPWFTTGTVTNIISLRDDGLWDYAIDRTHIAIQTLDGTWTPVSISWRVFHVGNIEFDVTPIVNIPYNQIKTISWLGLNRLNTDTLEIRYDTAKSAETSFLMLELSP